MVERERFEVWHVKFYGTVGVRSIEWCEIGYVDHTVQAQFVAWCESRRAALEECWEAVHTERLVDPTDSADDIAYQLAVEHCEHAIRALSKDDK